MISIVVPVYNSAQYLMRCVKSIFSQTYTNWELILVDDRSTDNSVSIIEGLVQQDVRIKFVKHNENRGSFHARITGGSLGNGKYITFIDSDDYVSSDWLQKLVTRAEVTGADITVGEWCFDWNGEERNYYFWDHFRRRNYYLRGNRVLEAFMKTRGRNYSWTVLWNKLYKKSLWDVCVPSFMQFSALHGNLVMWDDIAFSAGLWANAKKVTNIHGSYYFYCKNENQATNIKKEETANRKYIADAAAVMGYMKAVLQETGAFEKVRYDYESWNCFGMSVVYRDIVYNLNCGYLKEDILHGFGCKETDWKDPFSIYYDLILPLLRKPYGKGICLKNLRDCAREIYLGKQRWKQYRAQKKE